MAKLKLNILASVAVSPKEVLKKGTRGVWVQERQARCWIRAGWAEECKDESGDETASGDSGIESSGASEPGGSGPGQLDSGLSEVGKARTTKRKGT